MSYVVKTGVARLLTRGSRERFRTVLWYLCTHDPRTVWNGFPRRELFETIWNYLKLFETVWNYSELDWHYLQQTTRTVQNGSWDLMFRNHFWIMLTTWLTACNFHLKPCYLKIPGYFVVTYIEYMINHSCCIAMCVWYIYMSMYDLQ